ncbi:PDZ domain-containing protein [bacterium]|nr:PDZ domain-containing protein [bacterium]
MRIEKFLVILFIYFFNTMSFAAEPSGQKVESVDPGSTYEMLGVKPGDKILSFDGKPINSPKDSMELYTSLKKGSVKSVVVLRDGKKQTLHYEVK